MNVPEAETTLLFLRSHRAEPAALLVLAAVLVAAVTADQAVALSLSAAQPRRILTFVELIGVHTGAVLPAMVVPGLASWERPLMRVGLRVRSATLCIAVIAIPTGMAAAAGALSAGIPAPGSTTANVWLLTSLAAGIVPVVGPLAGPPISVAVYWALVMGDQLSPRWVDLLPLATSPASTAVTMGWAMALTTSATATWFTTGGQTRVARQLDRHAGGR